MARFPEARSDIGVPNTYYIVSIDSVFGISLALIIGLGRFWLAIQRDL